MENEPNFFQRIAAAMTWGLIAGVIDGIVDSICNGLFGSNDDNSW